MTTETVPASLLDDAFDHGTLLDQDFPPLEFLIPGVLPEGVSLVAGAPKAGKSWLVLDLAHALATAGPAFGSLDVGRARPVLYLALEDGPRRLQDRARKLDLTRTRPGMLVYKTSVLHGRGLATIREFLDRHAGEHPVVFVDTFAKIKPRPAPGTDAYLADYAVMSAFKDLVAEYPDASVVLVHHTRKMGAEDFSDTVAGSQGITGGVDTTVVLKRPRNDPGGTLFVTSRDAPEGEYAVTFDGTRWTLEGGTVHEASNAARERKAAEGLGDRMSEVVRFANHRPKTTPRDVADVLGMSSDDAGKYLRRAAAAGRIRKDGRGTYVPVSEASEVSEEDPPYSTSDTKDTSDTLSNVHCLRHPVTARPDICNTCAAS